MATELSTEKFLREWAKGSTPQAAVAQMVLMQLEDYESESKRMKEKLAEATRLAREIHEHLKRGKATQDHGLVENLRCSLDHILGPIFPAPLG